ncbi:hypothetical protein KHC28_01505 [Ancylobacter sonchi]|uniref:hypothetical protein n=1 Tax=Ancylobacter sonchi TaxID=1937790 RepID=UPI001BD302FD|nr:hypothetical protein [Ancylobacter sonchi]MBS7532329.1 hypothetical protein [Ancylobacter sonchi]
MSSSHKPRDDFWQSIVSQPRGFVADRGMASAQDPSSAVEVSAPETPTQAPPQSDTGEDDSYKAIRIDLKRDRQFLLELRYRDPIGNQPVTELVPYALIGRVQLMGTFLRIRLSDTGESILIEGRQLEQIIDPLRSATLTCLQEWNRNYHHDVGQDEPKISQISFLDPEQRQSRREDAGRER